nr:four helix bundle protein [Rasiella rasia]
MKRCSTSIRSNIARGAGRNLNKEFKLFQVLRTAQLMNFKPSYSLLDILD